MKNRKFRLVRECVILAAELVRLAVVLLNMAINYLLVLSREPQVVYKI